MQQLYDPLLLTQSEVLLSVKFYVTLLSARVQLQSQYQALVVAFVEFLHEHFSLVELVAHVRLTIGTTYVAT